MNKKLIHMKSFDFSTNQLNKLSREPNPEGKKPQKHSDSGCKNLFVYRYKNGRIAFYMRFNETISKGKYRKKEIYLSDFIPYGPAEQVDEVRIEVSKRNQSRKEDKPIVQDPIFSTIVTKFVREGLEGFRLKYLTKRRGTMRKYDKKNKKHLRNICLNVILHRTKKPELLQRLTRAITGKDTIYIKDKRVSKITPDDIDLIMQRLSSTPRMANIVKTTLSTIFEWAIIQGLCTHNPTKEVGVFDTNETQKITLDEFRTRKLIDYCHRTMAIKPHCRTLIVLLHCTGIRPEHLHELRWKQPTSAKEFEESRGHVNLEAGYIHIHRTKKDGKLTHYLDQDSAKILNKLNELIRSHPDYVQYARSRWVLPKLSKPDEPSNYDTYKKAIKSIYKKPALNLPEGYKNKYARKTAGTYIGVKFGEEKGSNYLDNSVEVFKKNYFDADKIKLKNFKMYDVEDKEIVQNEVVAIKGGKK